MSKPTPDHRSEMPGSASWIKSSFSFANSNCVEVASLPGGQVGVRDSKDPAGLVLRFTPGEWHAFVGGVRNGEFDRFGNLCSLWAGRVSVRLAWGEGSCGPSPLLTSFGALARQPEEGGGADEGVPDLVIGELGLVRPISSHFPLLATRRQ